MAWYDDQRLFIKIKKLLELNYILISSAHSKTQSHDQASDSQP